MITLQTRRFALRPLCADDFDAVHSYSSVPENVTYMIWGPNDEDATREFLRTREEFWNEDPVKNYDFGIVLPTGKLIGALGIYLDDARQQGMMGWILHRDYWRKGYMYEAASEVIRFGFEKLNLHRIYTYCYADNTPSYKLMEKLGMRREGHLIQARLLRNVTPDHWCDEYQYAILHTEWKDNNNA